MQCYIFLWITFKVLVCLMNKDTLHVCKVQTYSVIVKDVSHNEEIYPFTSKLDPEMGKLIPKKYN